LNPDGKIILDKCTELKEASCLHWAKRSVLFMFYLQKNNIDIFK